MTLAWLAKTIRGRPDRMKNYIHKGIKRIFPKKNSAQNELGCWDRVRVTGVAEKSFMLTSKISTYARHFESPWPLGATECVAIDSALVLRTIIYR